MAAQTFPVVSSTTASTRGHAWPGRFTLLTTLALVALSQAGCATPPKAAVAVPSGTDPLESWNRKVFGFNEALDRTVLAPVARGYVQLVPLGVRTRVGQFFSNPRDIGSAINLLLQGQPGNAASDVARVLVNTTVGVLGVFDVATPMGLTRHGADVGQTLGRWGVGSGAYIVWPVLGPSTLRDTAGLPVDLLLAPQAMVSSTALAHTLTALDVVDARAELLPATRLLEGVALDKYLFVRDAYLQRRQALVHGEPLPEPDGAGDGDSPCADAPAGSTGGNGCSPFFQP